MFDNTDSNDGSNESLGKYLIPSILGLVVLVLFGLVFLPTVQKILYTLLVASPATVQWGVVAVIIGAIGLYVNNEYVIGFGIVVFIGMGLFVGPMLSGVYAQEDMANQLNTDEIEVNNLPDSSNDHIRVLPREVADNYADSSIQKPQYGLSDSDLAYQNGQYKWSYGLVPDNAVVSWQGNQDGAVYVNMEQDSKDIEIKDDTPFNTGRGQLWFDSYDYKSVLSNPMVNHKWDTTFNSEGPNGEPYIAHSTISHNWKFKLLPVPQFYAIPQHGTVELMDTDGTVQSLTPEEATNNEMLDKENFYPYSISMFKVNSMMYKNGALNRWFGQKGVLEVTDLPSTSGNDWPLVVPVQTEDGDTELKYFIATEAIGSGSGVFEIWMMDGQTGETNVVRYNDSQIGPNRAMDFVGRQPDINRLSNANPVSPVPVVVDNQLFWQVKVIPQSESGIIYTGFVNAQSGDVTLVEGTEPIYDFLSEEEVDEIKNNQPTGNVTTVNVAVTDGNGEIVGTTNVTIPEGGEADIQIENPE